MAWLRISARIIRATSRKWRADNASGSAAALAYYALFSAVPLLIIVVAVAGLILGGGKFFKDEYPRPR